MEPIFRKHGVRDKPKKLQHRGHLFRNYRMGSVRSCGTWDPYLEKYNVGPLLENVVMQGRL